MQQTGKRSNGTRCTQNSIHRSQPTDSDQLRESVQWQDGLHKEGDHGRCTGSWARGVGQEELGKRSWDWDGHVREVGVSIQNRLYGFISDGHGVSLVNVQPLQSADIELAALTHGAMPTLQTNTSESSHQIVNFGPLVVGRSTHTTRSTHTARKSGKPFNTCLGGGVICI